MNNQNRNSSNTLTPSALVCLLFSLALWGIAPLANAQGTDLEPPPTPAPPDGKESREVAPTEPPATAPAPSSTAGSPAALATSEPAHAGVEQLRRSVVRISVTSQVPDYNQPWSPGGIGGGSGTGFLISDNRILTNAHVVSNARLITLEKEGDSRKYRADVKFVAHDCDLAMLEVEDSSFFEGMAPLQLDGVPKLDSTVSVFGYPIGGDRLSITRGVVSRIDFVRYQHSSIDLHLAIQIDAAINPGNSGGPVLQDGEVVGVAFQGYSGDIAQNVGFMIPIPVIQRFLTDVKDGEYDNYVDLAISYFPLVNAAYRRAIGLGPGDQGVVVTTVYRAGGSYGVLERGDVLLEIDGYPIYSDGTVELGGERVDLAEIVERKFADDTVELKILREGEEKTVTISPNSPWPVQIQGNIYNKRPRYVVFGGLVFQPLTQPYLRAHGIDDVNIMWHFSNFLDKEIYQDRPEIIIFSNVLPDPINTHVAGFTQSIVDEINGVKIRVLEDVSKAFEKSVDFHVIRLLGNGRPIVLENSAVERARERIMQGYGIQEREYLGDGYVPDDIMAELEESYPVMAEDSEEEAEEEPAMPSPAKPTRQEATNDQ